MTAQAPAKKGFSKSMLPDEIAVPCTFGSLYKDDDGNPIAFKFYLRLETEADAEAIERVRASGATQQQVNVERLAALISKAPDGFDDFPAEGGSLKQRAKDYFAGDDMAHIVNAALSLYGRVVNPVELFRSL